MNIIIISSKQGFPVISCPKSQLIWSRTKLQTEVHMLWCSCHSQYTGCQDSALGEWPCACSCRGCQLSLHLGSFGKPGSTPRHANFIGLGAAWTSVFLKTCPGDSVLRITGNNKKYSTKKIWEITMSFLAVGFNDQRKCITFS